MFEFEDVIEVIGCSDVCVVLLCVEGFDFSFGGDIVMWLYFFMCDLRMLFECYFDVFNCFECLLFFVIVVV